MNVPATLGVPLIVIVFDANDAVTPVGRPDGAPMPVAPVVVCVMFGESAVLMQRVCGVEAVTVLLGEMVTVVEVELVQPQAEAV